MYFALEEKKSRPYNFIISMILSIVLSMFIGIVTISFGVILLSLFIILISTLTLSKLFSYYSQSRIQKTYNFFIVICILLFVITSVVPSLTGSLASVKNFLTTDEKNALEWLGKNIKEDPIIIIIGKNEDVYAISFFTDTQGILASSRFENNIDNSLTELRDLFEISLNTEAIRVLSMYDVDYIFISETLANSLTDNNLEKFEDSCFERVYRKNKVQIFKRLCTFKKEEEFNKELFDS